MVTIVTKELNQKCKYIKAILFCTVFACTDELHQIFVPGRTASINDVFIDLVGSIAAIGFIAFIECIRFRTTHYKS